MEETLRHNSLSQQTPSLSQQTPVVNKTPTSTNPVVNEPRRPQTLSLLRFSRHRDSATLCYLLLSSFARRTTPKIVVVVGDKRTYDCNHKRGEKRNYQ
ncbi:hypothetical protein DEO72_LG3g2200 [Vigna unguiculata]|uniref:Uncharacterized protein n=1 Tax=Vigna unguiculata TaxID=3917 RepID=A0A4D6LGF2_VIGUN|nr:hypothetical protein DEO72_LG3g2200 [Vigna unguiculata]